jgi:hypothetical protein
MQTGRVDKMHFMIKYPPKRPTFALDMTEAEREIMGRHIAYWTDLMNRGHVLVFGPVMAPGGFYGLGIVEAGQRGADHRLYPRRSGYPGRFDVHGVLPDAGARAAEVMCRFKPLLPEMEVRFFCVDSAKAICTRLNYHEISTLSLSCLIG